MCEKKPFIYKLTTSSHIWFFSTSFRCMLCVCASFEKNLLHEASMHKLHHHFMPFQFKIDSIRSYGWQLLLNSFSTHTSLYYIVVYFIIFHILKTHTHIVNSKLNDADECDYLHRIIDSSSRVGMKLPTHFYKCVRNLKQCYSNNT